MRIFERYELGLQNETDWLIFATEIAVFELLSVGREKTRAKQSLIHFSCVSALCMLKTTIKHEIASVCVGQVGGFQLRSGLI